MVDFNSTHKEEQSKYFEEGIHKVKIMAVSEGVNDNEKPYIEFTVVGEDNQEGTARMWFTTDKAIAFTFNTIRSIFVHNALEGKKDEARDRVNKVSNSEELVELCVKALINKEAFYVVEKSDYTYTNAAGESKQGFNRNLLGYEPKPKQSSDTAVNSTFGGGEDVEVPANVLD